MPDQLPESFRWSCALSKQLSSAHTLASSCGDLELDDELRGAIDHALRPLLERRLHQAEHCGCPDPLQALAALYLNLTPGERKSLKVFIETWHHHDSQAALADLRSPSPPVKDGVSRARRMIYQ